MTSFRFEVCCCHVFRVSLNHLFLIILALKLTVSIPIEISSCENKSQMFTTKTTYI